MELSLKDRKVVITGAGDGIGRALALAFAEAGAQVAGCARSADRLKSLSTEIKGTGHLLETADVTNAEDIQQFFEKIEVSWDAVDTLVNNAGAIGKLATFFDLDDDDWQKAFEVNLLSAVRLSRAFIPVLKNSDFPGIINISSIAASRPGEIFPHYCAMKAGMSALSASLSTTLAKDGIRVNTVSPGPVWSRSWEQEAEQAAQASGKSQTEMAEEIRNSTASTVPLKRMGLPEDVTGLVLFLSSVHASWITGSNFVVDGGVLRQPY